MNRIIIITTIISAKNRNNSTEEMGGGGKKEVVCVVENWRKRAKTRLTLSLMMTTSRQSKATTATAIQSYGDLCLYTYACILIKQKNFL